jgi:UDP:flavonoid glycosyltransferase YjiC (YdhE family)
VPRDKYKAKRAAAELETLLRDPETAPAYAAAAKKAGQHLAEENGTMAACDALEKLASAGSSRHPQPIANSQ